jgi:hypothetical protein
LGSAAGAAGVTSLHLVKRGGSGPPLVNDPLRECS